MVIKKAINNKMHTMTTNFSGTDEKEIIDNAGAYNYYLSLIVNFALKYTAKIAIKSRTKYKREVIDENKKSVWISEETESLCIHECNIIHEEPPFDTAKALDIVLKKAKAAIPKTYPKYPRHGRSDMYEMFPEYYESEAIVDFKREFPVANDPDDITNAMNPMSILSDLEVDYTEVEALTAVMISGNINNTLPLADIIDSRYETYKKTKGSIVPNVTTLQLDRFINMFKTHNNLDIPNDVISDAVNITLEEVKSQGKNIDHDYNKFIDYILVNIGD